MSADELESGTDSKDFAATTLVNFYTEFGRPCRRIKPLATGNLVYTCARTGATRTIAVTSGEPEDIQATTVTAANAVAFRAYA